jgi:molybdopterin/thiamine biosynthesis adenylyltransferase
MALTDKGLARLGQASLAVVGTGLLGRRITELLALTGYGELLLIDPDEVSLENAIQGYNMSDVGKPKVVACAEALGRLVLRNLSVWAWAITFEELAAQHPEALLNINVAIVATDNMPTRHAVCDHFYGHVPVVVAGLSEDGPHGFVFVQEVSGACLRCALPQLGAEGGAPCAAITPDIGSAIAALSVHATTSLVLPEVCVRSWGLRFFSLSGDFDFAREPEELSSWEDCPRCGGKR